MCACPGLPNPWHWKGKGYITLPAYKGSLAGAKKVPVSKSVRTSEIHVTQSQHFRHSGTSLANPRTPELVEKEAATCYIASSASHARRLEEMGIAINMCRGQEQTKDKKRTVQRAGDRNEYRKVQTGGRKEMKR
eukprot:1161079-Pelagomonas_calceolata.AAC.14